MFWKDPLMKDLVYDYQYGTISCALLLMMLHVHVKVYKLPLETEPNACDNNMI